MDPINYSKVQVIIKNTEKHQDESINSETVFKSCHYKYTAINSSVHSSKNQAAKGNRKIIHRKG